MWKIFSVFLIVIMAVSLTYAADTKVSALTELAAAPSETDELYINYGGVSKKITVLNMIKSLNTGMTGVTIATANAPLLAPLASPTFTTKITTPLIDLGTGISVTGGAGVVTFTDLAGTSEVLALDLRTSNTAKFTTSSGITKADFVALNMVTTGTISGKIPMITKSGNYTLGTDDAQEAYGYMTWMSGANATLTLPAVSAGMSGCLYSTDAEIKRLDPNASDGLRMGAARDTDGDAIASTAAIGAFVCFVADGTDGWTILGKNGTWAAE